MARRRPTIVRTLEFGRVPLPARFNTAATRERLEQAALRAGIRAFEIRGRELYAQGVVGVVDLGGLVVEILPKTHDGCTSADGALFLSELLRFSGVMTGLVTSSAQVAGGELTMLEIVLAWAVRAAADNIREGLPRRYEVREETTTAVRGRIELRHLTRRPPGKDFELVVRHAPLSENNPLSRIVKWLLQQVAGRTRIGATRLMSRRLLQELDDVGDARPGLADLERIVLQPTEARWRPLLEFARLLLRQVSPDPTRGGVHESVAVLFTLHDLFERVLRRVFRDGLASHDLALRIPNRRLLQALPPGAGELLSLEPDFLFVGVAPPALTLIGDAKWKRILTADGAVTLSEADAYQLTTYLSVFGAPAGFIFCPLAAAPPVGRLTTANFRISGQGSTLHVTGVHLPTLISAGADGVETRAALCAYVAAPKLMAAGVAA